jgi:hypothetical protein
MFWWFERGGKFLRCETSDRPGGGYELRVASPDGSEQVETFDDSAELNRRQREVEEGLASQGWTGPHGWNL